MTIQALWLLKLLKKAQINPQNEIGIDLEDLTVVTVHDVTQKHVTVKLNWYKNSLDPTLSYLEGQGYIRYGEVISQVLYPGWHIVQTALCSLASFLVKSIAVPIGVSLATTLITLWLNGKLP